MMCRLSRLLCTVCTVAVVGATSGCASPGARPISSSPGQSPGTSPLEPPTARPAVHVANPGNNETAPGSHPTTIDRHRLHTVLDAGAGAFLATVAVRPFFDGNRFVGWEIVEARGFARAGGFRASDVVRSINGQGLERPENLHTMWEKLRQAASLVVEGTRNGEDFSFEFAIHDQAPPAKP